MRSLDLPNPSEFVTAAKTHFSFLEENGFVVSSEVRGTGETVVFKGAYAAVAVSTDRRDGTIDLAISELSGTDPNPLWQHFFGFLVSRAGYRGSLREFRGKEVQDGPGVPQLQIYASALGHFLPRLVAGVDAPLTLGPNYSLKRTDQSLRD
jgi:hypothetical protein